MAIPARLELLTDLAQKTARLTGALTRIAGAARLRLDRAAAKLPDLPNILGAARQRLDDRTERLALALPNFCTAKRTALERLANRLIHPREFLLRRRADVAMLSHRLTTPLPNRLRDNRTRLEGLAARLESVSYAAVLARGFALVTNTKGTAISSAAAVPPGAALHVRFSDGEVNVTAAGRQGVLPL
jgi:exodeoxyribonuclease VII large subunit